MKNSPIRREIRPQPNQAQGRHSDGPMLESNALFAGGNEVVITHGAELYRLRLTRQNRLILTK
ncbi:protein of unknown function [Georgfuchsia toluolica]|uniref:Hemin uptake protein HemP n=1 Tax=Georgfuchsia toluolica TaxID=424218 RepID=A0A916J5Z7_9PROT|nr:hemin uptake protein HemP [Georgfuchsia toluolica]CAG4885351.1 protein of unknown function [Georgfuchsia toluolica]